MNPSPSERVVSVTIRSHVVKRRFIHLEREKFDRRSGITAGQASAAVVEHQRVGIPDVEKRGRGPSILGCVATLASVSGVAVPSPTDDLIGRLNERWRDAAAIHDAIARAVVTQLDVI